MSKNIKRENKKEFVKKLIKKEKKGLIIIGGCLVCISFLLVGSHFSTNDSCEDRQQRIERMVEEKSEFCNEFENIANDIIFDCQYSYNIDGIVQTPFAVGQIFEMVIQQEDKDIIVEQCNTLIKYMEEEDVDIVNGYKLKQLIMEKY